MATRLAVSADQTTPVTYQQFLPTPAAVALSPTLTFANPIAMQGTLQDPLNSPVNYSLAQIKTDANGIANLTVTAQAPGFPTLRFFVQDGQQAPVIPFSFPLNQAFTDFLAPLLALRRNPNKGNAL